MLKLLPNPYVIGAVLVFWSLSIGYGFHKGRLWERRSQANAVVDLNDRLGKLQLKEAKTEAEFEARLNQAVSQSIPASVGGACALDEASIKRIRAIAKTAD